MSRARCAEWLVLIVSLQGAACGSRARRAPPPPPASAPRNAGGLFEESAGLRCSADPKVGCSGILPLRRGAGVEVGVLRSGEEAFRARVASLRAARRSIRVQALIFKADEAGLFIADLLKKRRGDGLDVRVIVDAVSNLDWQTQWMYFDLKQHGVEVEGYEALYLQWLTADLRPSDPLRPNKRFHDKLWVIDAEDPRRGRAILGGLNIANEYFRLDPDVKKRWRDQDLITRGPLVADAARVFDRNYAYFKELKSRLPPTSNPDNLWRLTRATLHKVRKIQVPEWRRPEVTARVAAEAARPFTAGFHAATARLVQSRPRLRETFIGEAYRQLIDRARSRVLLANAYFVPSRALTASLRGAARRGVRMEIITNSPESNDIRAVALISRHLYFSVLSISEDPEVKRQVRAAAVVLREWIGPAAGEGTLHSKVALFDEDVAIVGSYNLDPRSENLNSETVLVLRSRPIVEELEQLIRREYLPRSRIISLEEARTLHSPDEPTASFQTLFYLPLKDWL